MTHRLHPLTCILATAMLAPLAQAETSPYYIGVSQTFQHESNLLRLGDGEAAPAPFSKSDTISSTSVLAGIDQPIGRQRLFGNVALRDNRMRRNTEFNNQGYALTTGLDWETAERVSGTLKYIANRNLARFNAENIGLVTDEKNIETTRDLEAKVRVGVVTALTAELGAGHRSVDYSAAKYQARDFRQDSVSLGAQYRPSSLSTFGLALRQAKGTYPNFRPTGGDVVEADRYTRKDIDLSLSLLPSAASNLYARVSLGKIDYDLSTQRNFSGLTGVLKWLWAPTGKLRFDTRLTREPGQDSYFLSNAISDATVEYSRVSTGVQLRADYDLTAKISAYASAGYTQRSLARTLSGVEPVSTDSDHVTSTALGASWAPTRALQLGCDLTQDRRRGSGPLTSNLTDTTFACHGQFTLQ
jgi:hypothetical protein